MLHFQHVKPDAAETVTGEERPVLAQVWLRRLAEGVDYKAVERAWRHQSYVNSPVHIVDMQGIEDPRERLTVKLFPAANDKSQLPDFEVVSKGLFQETHWTGNYAFMSEHDFQRTATEIPLRSSESIFRFGN